MLFNSVQFILFFMAFCSLYFFLPLRYRIWLILFASYGFYMAWKPIYGLLMSGVTAVSYWGAYQVRRSEATGQKRFYLGSTVLINLGILCYFKYADFGIQSLNTLLHTLGLGTALPAARILLPVGISFYIFQSLSFAIDVYRNKRANFPSLLDFASYIAFFPQLVAGPIERADKLIPQLKQHVEWDVPRVNSGLRLMLWGFFKKVVVADNLLLYVDAVYNNPSIHTGPTIMLATVALAFRIYCDFSGYSDIAIGSARVLGMQLTMNFNRPYSSQSITEFWQRWHISLSSWLRDYLFRSLGGGNVRKIGRFRASANLLVTMLLGGLWHGASWNYVLWGGLQGVFLAIERALFQKGLPQRATGLAGAIRTMVTFGLVCFSWIILRANSIPDFVTILSRLPVGWPNLFVSPRVMGHCAIGLFILLLVEHADSRRLLRWFEDRRPFRIAFYYSLAVLILLIGVHDGGEFIYFQF